MIFRIDPRSGMPLYLQLIEQVRHAVEIGALRTGDQLPGMRKLAEELVMNPNTVAKAYREMEHAGLIELRHGAGAFVAGGQADSPPGILKGLARSRSGTAAMFGVPAGSTPDIFKRVAFVPEIKELYPYVRAAAMIR